MGQKRRHRIGFLLFAVTSCYLLFAICRLLFMSIENILMLTVCALLMVYLIYALLRPEKF